MMKKMKSMVIFKMGMAMMKAIIIITREEWRSSQLISSKVMETSKFSAMDKMAARDKALTSEGVSATEKQSTATFAFRGFMGNYR